MRTKLGAASMLMGLFGFATCGLCSVPGLIMAVVALYKNKDDASASWGAIMCTIPCLIWFFWIIFIKFGL